MKVTKSLRMLIAMFVFLAAFAMTQKKVEAMQPTYTPIIVNELQEATGQNMISVTVQPKSEEIVPIVISGKGVTKFITQGEQIGEYDYVDGTLYEDQACTVSARCNMSFKQTVGERIFSSDSNAIYYLKLENCEDTPLNIYLQGYFFSGSSRTIKSGKVYGAASVDSSKFTLYKFKATKTGYVEVSCKDLSSYNYPTKIKLLNNKKKSLSNEINLNKNNYYTTAFAVQKGKTYYFATKTYADIYGIIYKQNKVKEKSGKQKSKAVTIKRNKTVKGIQLANNKKSGNDWYKIKLTKSKNFKLYVVGKSTENIKIKIIPANRGTIISYGNTINVPGYGKYEWKTTNRWPAGTYYIQVYKTNKKASGYYSIKWK